MNLLASGLQLLAGIGLFLLAMQLLENSLKNLSGRNFKLFLQRTAGNKAGAVAGGALVTAILQSSSMVSLMVLSFVGAGVLGMTHALAIILGANLGTTLASWLVATLGFKVNIEVVAYPAVCIAGILMVSAGSRKMTRDLSNLLFGFGLLFIGLSFMKTAMEIQVSTLDLSRLVHLPLISLVLTGFLITVIVQSSSVTMALTLTALHAGVLDFPSGAALVLGAETGTSIKLIVGAVGASVVKKRVALGNILFNLILTIVTFSLLRTILYGITDVLGIRDPLIGLVTFSTLTNLLAILLFLPWLERFAALLDRFFTERDTAISAYIGNANIKHTPTALELFSRETGYFLHSVFLYNMSLLDIQRHRPRLHPEFMQLSEKKKFFSMTPERKYEYLKKLQGELQAFYLRTRPYLEGEQTARMGQLITAVRSAMHAAKSLTDVESNIHNLQQSSKDIKFNFFLRHKTETDQLYTRLDELLDRNGHPDFETLKSLMGMVQREFVDGLNNFYKEAQHAPINDLDITTIINFNRELFTSNKAILMAVKDYLLEEKEAEEFNELPVYST